MAPCQRHLQLVPPLPSMPPGSHLRGGSLSTSWCLSSSLQYRDCGRRRLPGHATAPPGPLLFPRPRVVLSHLGALLMSTNETHIAIVQNPFSV